MENVLVQVVRAFCIGGERQEVESEVSVSRLFARELVSLGKAVLVEAVAEVADKPKRKKAD